MITKPNTMGEFAGNVNDDNSSERTSLELDDDQNIDQLIDYEAVARQYLSTKQRLNYCRCYVFLPDFRANQQKEWICYYPFTDEQLSRIRQIIKEDELKIDVFDDGFQYYFFPDRYYDEYPDCDIISSSYIDVDSIHYRCKMSCVFADTVEEFTIELSDSEYIYLLAKELTVRPYNSFNRLLSENIELALKINAAAQEPFPFMDGKSPYAIVFDEIREDAFAIDGLEPAEIYFSESMDGDRTVTISAYAERHKLTLILKAMSCTDTTTFRYTMNADEMMKYLGEVNYQAMIDRLEEFTIIRRGTYYINDDFMKSTGIPYTREIFEEDCSDEFNKYLESIE